ncbi:hypothetical protein [Sporolactobacillus putidus]|uniref:Uncharacterized protein n=1 Tax=Sporolactobacillus putidus TaxID=492735 RepID=A0A917W4V9_9BACL|nr:hypothetical protein [Sporolactobacillus putidus]GGL62871.1 hypothetical protein GCM10007968_28530 [Sporolactobacillus putidus]
MPGKKTSEAQIKASRNWEAKNHERKRYMSKKSTAKSFIRIDANQADLDELKDLIREKEESLRSSNKE